MEELLVGIGHNYFKISLQNKFQINLKDNRFLKINLIYINQDAYIKDLDELNMISLPSTEAFSKCSEVYL